MLGVALALAGEGLAIVLGHKGFGLSWLLSIHAVTALAAGLVLLEGRREDDDLTLAASAFLAVLAAGPLGALAAFALLVLPARDAGKREVLDNWYRRLAEAGGVEPATAMHDRVAAGRVLILEAEGPQRFEEVIAHGTLVERQTALGLMARRFHPDYVPALEAALRSAEPVVRVQAAAVVARVRADLKSEIKAASAALLAERGLDLKERLKRAGRLEQLASCGLVEEADRATCRQTLGAVLERVLARDGVLAAAQLGARGPAGRALENFLLSSGRLKEFRRARSGLTVAGKGYRLRARPARLQGGKAS